jgi:hypothetical protein
MIAIFGCSNKWIICMTCGLKARLVLAITSIFMRISTIDILRKGELPECDISPKSFTEGKKKAFFFGICCRSCKSELFSLFSCHIYSRHIGVSPAVRQRRQLNRDFKFAPKTNLAISYNMNLDQLMVHKSQFA